MILSEKKYNINCYNIFFLKTCQKSYVISNIHIKLYNDLIKSIN